MSDTDIYKKREPMPYGNRDPRRSRRSRSSAPRRAFDDHSRKRRSKNSGLRRLLHLYRKKENEKVFWWTLLGAIIFILFALGLWQFVIREKIINDQEKQDDYVRYQKIIEHADEDAVPSATE